MPTWLVERMGTREDLMQDDPERPHVDLGGVRVVAGGVVPHLRCDIGERADLRVKAAVFGGPFRGVEVAELDPDRKDGGDEDVLPVLDSISPELEGRKQTDGLMLR